MSLSEYSNPPAMSNWGYPLYECNCCPYGFHIDLDFVRYCESISKEADRTGSIQRRKDRRRQRKSMEVLLGLESITQQNYARPPEPISPIPEIENRLQKQDSFDNVIDDFEKTLQRSKSKLSHNLPDVTAVSDIRRTGQMSSETVPPMPRHMTVTKYPQREYDNANEYCNLSPTTFKNIREQMALSLERTRQLEEQMKQLPELKVQISKLKDENQRLLLKLKQQEDMKLNLTTTSYSQTSYNRRNRSNSSSDADSYHENEGRKPFMPISTKEMGVGYSVLTRNVGVGHQTPSRKNVSTETTPDGIFADKWFGEKLKFISDNFEGGETDNYPLRKISTITKGCQTQNSNNSNQSSQTVEILEPKKIFINKQTQISHPATNQKSVGVLVKPSTNEVGIQKFVEVYNIGVSDDTITDIHCEKCNVAKISIGVGADKSSDTHTAPVSLASLSFPRSKSFNLGEDKINLNVRNRSIGLQYHYKAESSSKSSQYESLSTSRSCQSTVKTLSRAVQYELKVVDSSTQSEVSSFRTSTRDVSCEAVMKITETKSVGCNTTWVLPTNTVCSKCEDRERRRQEEAINATNSEGPSKKEDIKRDDSRKKDELSVGNTSRIPRLTLTPTPERRKFRRQDTYTKINTSPPPEESHVRLSGLDLSSKPSGTGPSSTFDKVKENFKFPVASKSIHTQNETNRQPINAPTTEFSSNPSSIPYVSTTTTKHRKKATPSKEMQGAMKVLNDSLLKRIALPKSHKAIDIIQQEWFKISGLISANPLDVEDYLDAFEDMSSLLLDYIVNMTDGSGNTSMHYAVSHGNFDVVSILLDSKVCDINKPNTAGYTSVMLVSLSDIRSSTHANVVRRLFQMADVNIRAKQHGQTALMLAVSHGRIEMVKMLLEAGADINIQDDDGSTALMCAAEHGHIEIVKHFLSQPDCDSTITDVDGSTALKIAMEAEHRPIGVLLYAHERNLIGAHGHKHKKKPLSPKPPSSPLSIRQSHSALNETKNSNPGIPVYLGMAGVRIQDDIPLADDDPQVIINDEPEQNSISEGNFSSSMIHGRSMDSIQSTFTNGSSSPQPNSLEPDTSPDEQEEKARLISQVLELQNTLDDLSQRVDSVKEENLKLRSENQVLGQYIENLMSASSVFQSTSPKIKKK